MGHVWGCRGPCRLHLGLSKWLWAASGDAGGPAGCISEMLGLQAWISGCPSRVHHSDIPRSLTCAFP